MTSKINPTLVSDFLFSLGCCRICVMRFLRPEIDDFLDVDGFFDRKNLHPTISKSEPALKKQKTDPCSACHGLFSFVDELVDKIKSSPSLRRYEVNQLVTTYSLPVLLELSNLQIWLSLIEKFPNTFDSERQPDTPTKDVLKNIINTRLMDELHYDFNPDGLQINVFFAIDGEQLMMEKLERVAPELMVERNKQRKKFRGEIVSRNYFEKFFVPKKIDLDRFRGEIPVPPEPPTDVIRLDKITFTGPTVFVAGRYNKFSRNLSQSPWVLNGKCITEGSVQEIIVSAVLPHFQAPEPTVTFMSSGREDVDVRCLGRGRPFVLEIMNSTKTVLEVSKAIEMEQQVKQSGQVGIRDLQMVRRDDLHHIKSGEEDKKKMYRALCTVSGEVDTGLLERLNIGEKFVTQQWTPLRVLHRRTLMKRPRTIFSVKAHAVKGQPRVVVLDIVTQAGTYVKELVHGEFKRTEPSIASLIGMEIDIVALDVMNIDLDFPKSLTR